jgi:hypothetical protein
MTLRKRQGTVNRKRKHHIALCGELVLEEAKDLSQDGVRNEEALELWQTETSASGTQYVPLPTM